MSRMYPIELCDAGPDDGRRAQVDEAIIRAGYFYLPRRPVLTRTPQPDEVVEFWRDEWEWDGTFTRSGAFRFRLAQP